MAYCMKHRYLFIFSFFPVSCHMIQSSSTSYVVRRSYWQAHHFPRWKVWPLSRVRPWFDSAACQLSKTWLKKSRLTRWVMVGRWVVCSLTLRNSISNHLFCLLLQQFFMWIESNTPELAVPYLWSEEKQSSEYIHCVQTLKPSKKQNKHTTVYIFV